MRDTVSVHRAGFALGLTLATVVGVSLPAADLRNVLTDYTVTAWTARDGLPPGNVWALAQDGAGYLWVGSDRGLFRFDGVRFIHWAAEAQRFGTTPGALAAGRARRHALGRVRRRRRREQDSGGVVRGFGEGDGLPGGAIMVLLEDAAGTMWAGGDAGLFSLSGDRWVKWQADRGLPDAAVYAAYADSRGAFYVGTESGVFERLASEAAFRQIEGSADTAALDVDDDTLGSRRSFTEDASGRVPATVGRFPRSFVEDASGRVLVNDWNTGFRAVGRTARSGHRAGQRPGLPAAARSAEEPLGGHDRPGAVARASPVDRRTGS